MDQQPACASEAKAAVCGSAHHEPHFYGGQAVIEGVMMRGTDRYAVAVRRGDGEVVLAEKAIENFGEKHKWAKWPLIRGNVGLIDSLVLGFASLQFSADVLTQEENEKLAAAKAAAGGAPEPEATPEAEAKAEGGIGPIFMGLTMVLSSAMAIGLFIILPTWVVDWVLGKSAPGASYGDSVVRNLVEGGLRLLVIVLYILTISLMGYIRRVFQYHGAEHATINCLEMGETVTPESCLRFSPLHPRCGTAFLLVVIVMKIIVGCFFGWPALPLRMFIRLALLPLVAGLAYEVVRWAGRHRQSVLSRILAAPGMLMQVLTTRKPDASQVQVAMYALAAVASELELPGEWPPARRLTIPLHAKVEEAKETEEAG